MDQAFDGDADGDKDHDDDPPPAASDGSAHNELADWQTLRLAYERTGEPIAAMAARVGLSETQLRRRARRAGWLRRYGSPTASGAARKALILRLYAAIDMKLSQLEARMESDDGLEPADHERETRALGNLIATVEKVSGLETEGTRRTRRRPDSAHGKAESNGSGAGGRAAGGAVEGRDTELLRLELAERILRLREKQA